MIEIRTIRKKYGRVQALDDFNLQVPRGAIFGLVGPNGAGKSTLLKILATLIRPDGGSATIDGKNVVSEQKNVRAATGYQPDVPGLYQQISVEQYLAFFAAAFHLRGPERARAIERALEHSGLAERRHDEVEALSFGMKQRLVLAKTLIHSPRVLLLDEPATGLDPLARIHLRDQLRALRKSGVTILVSSHILSDLEDICTDVAFIGGGRNVSRSYKETGAESTAEGRKLLCELEVIGDAASAYSTATAFQGARVTRNSGNALQVEISGDEQQAAALLRHLVMAGILVSRFTCRGPGLEEVYKDVFGGPRS
jgi:ABC-2 type transport system ATP-binding protein